MALTVENIVVAIAIVITMVLATAFVFWLSPRG